ncbi:hypothetical protein ColTof4_07426 [Colletotrichum tofieldiae]|nr:hypothetical protein ColTof3_12375 [Colletotrichum tofieldiae]GKT75003.1 hypothetical protein ColTof4_07426 [Colletotrichum tofieldiae]GKT92221.1 hypothetical protein Ct61P_10071 [Colletotrichum tofieldiae]
MSAGWYGNDNGTWDEIQGEQKWPGEGSLGAAASEAVWLSAGFYPATCAVALSGGGGRGVVCP